MDYERLQNRSAFCHGKTPCVSIGMPVYNGEKFICEALDSLLLQTFTDFELIISDNASTDNTDMVCLKYAGQDTRIRYIRQPMNLGMALNFKFVLDEAVAEYFMWAACDDLRSNDFLEVNLAFLRDNPVYLASTSPVKFLGNNFDEHQMGDESLESESRYDRIIHFFQCWHANGRFYSLFRRSAVADWLHINASYLGSDWSLITHIANKGKLKRVSEGWVELGIEGISNTTDIFSLYRLKFIDWILPFNKLSLDTWSYMYNASLFQKFRLIYRLLRLNYQAFRAQFRVARERK